ncbi:hypothetical protein [Hydrogenophaga sp.]|uniref:hypothetical protein n=1 Tax=Hydrogenophaga sp. TaxID=1904254 RepID=UPI00271A4BF9|nr:hypothetical protein [Hydrogenophaga sp.]MDO9437230.1 hypothetical protein [Hydrogenophaga sp.]
MSKLTALITAKLSDFPPQVKKAVGLDSASGKTGIVSVSPQARRSADSVVTHVGKRAIEKQPSDAGGTGAKNDLLRQENDELRKQYREATKREYRSAVSPEDSRASRLAPKTLRLRLENRRLQQENRYLEQFIAAQKKIHHAVKSADQQMSKVFAALVRGDTTGVRSHSRGFVESIELLNKNGPLSTLSQGDPYAERLQMRIAKMSQNDLVILGDAAENHVGKMRDTLVENLHFSVASELLFRNDPRSTGYGVLSNAQLGTIVSCTTLLLDRAKEQGLATDPSDMVRGTRFLLGDLQRIHKDASERLATQIVQDPATTTESLQNRSIDDFDQVAWAVDFGNAHPTLFDQGMNRKLKQLDAEVKMHRADVQQMVSSTKTRVSALTHKELGALQARLAVDTRLSTIARQAAGKVLADEVTSRKARAVLEFQARLGSATAEITDGTHKASIDAGRKLLKESALLLQKASDIFQALGQTVSDKEQLEWIDATIDMILPYNLEILQRNLAGRSQALGNAVSKADGSKTRGGFDYVAQLVVSVDAAVLRSRTPIAPQ